MLTWSYNIRDQTAVSTYKANILPFQLKLCKLLSPGDIHVVILIFWTSGHFAYPSCKSIN